VRHPDQPPIRRIAPRMVGTGQHLGAAAGPIHEPRPAVTADIGERPHLAIIAADDDHAFAEIIEAMPVAGAGYVVEVAYDLPCRPDQPLHLNPEIFWV